MTAKEIQRIDSLTARLEALENSISDRDVRECLHNAKNEMLRALRKAEGKLR